LLLRAGIPEEVNLQFQYVT